MSMKALLTKIYDKLLKINTQLDYAKLVRTQSYEWTHGTAGFLSGVTLAGASFYLIGNLLYCLIQLNISSSAQTTIGTGNVTNRTLATFTFNNKCDTTSTDNSVRITNVQGIGTYSGIAANSGYSSGSACPVAGYALITYSGTTVTLTLDVAAVKAKTSNMRFEFCYPVIRMEPYV